MADLARKRISSEYLEVLGLNTSPIQVTREYLELLATNNLSQSDLAYLEVLQPVMSAHQQGKIYLETIMDHVEPPAPPYVPSTNSCFWVGGWNPHCPAKWH